jgi:hypothetical protein
LQPNQRQAQLGDFSVSGLALASLHFQETKDVRKTFPIKNPNTIWTSGHKKQRCEVLQELFL